MNKVLMAGRLTRDPEIRYSQGANATAVARFTIAVDRRFKREGEPEADFFNCSAFGKTAEFIEKYFKQGNKILIVGRVENDNYTNKDGQKVYGTRIAVEEAEFGEGKANASDKNQNGSIEPNTASQTKIEPKTDESGFMNIPDSLEEELPFN